MTLFLPGGLKVCLLPFMATSQEWLKSLKVDVTLPNHHEQFAVKMFLPVWGGRGHGHDEKMGRYLHNFLSMHLSLVGLPSACKGVYNFWLVDEKQKQDLCFVVL